MTAATITKQKLLNLGAHQGLISRFIEQTGNTDQPVDILSLIGAENATDDLLWLAGQTLPKIKIVQFAVECAESVLHLNSDPRAIAAIQSAKDWLEEPSEENRLLAREAFTYANNATYDTDAARAAYYAANAAAADNAYAAINTAYAAAAAACAVEANDAANYANAAAIYANAYADYAESNEVVQTSLMNLFSE
ncbi:MAG: hypothetical protein ACJAYB_000029 [Psychromonas sp.]|jgi:hypothetical protein